MTTKTQGSIGNPIRLLMHIPVPWVFALTYFAGLAVEAARPMHVRTDTRPGVVIGGWILVVAGVIIAAWSQWLFRTVGTTTVPGKASSTLVTRGPYQLSRNPMYVALGIAYLGLAGIQGQPWPVVLLPLTIAYLHWIVIPVEEARLREVFGGTYEAYQARVRRWL